MPQVQQPKLSADFFFFDKTDSWLNIKTRNLSLVRLTVYISSTKATRLFFVSNIFKETETDIQPLPQKIKIQRFIIELVDYYTTFWLNIYSAKTKTK